MKLEANNQFKPTKIKVKEILQNYNLDYLGYKELTMGIENVSLKVFTGQGNFVLRFLRKNKKADAKLLQELDYMGYLLQHGLPVPKLFQTIQNRKFLKYKDSPSSIFQCVLMEYMPGVHIKKYSKAQLYNLAITVAKLETLGEKYAKLQGMKFKTKFLYSLKKPTIKIKNPELQNFFKRSLTYKAQIIGTKNVGFYHVDLDNRNMLFSGHKVSAILDFDDSMMASTVHDLAALVEDIIALNNNTSDGDYFILQYKKHKNLGTDIKHVKRLVHIFNFFYTKVEIELYGEKSRRIPKLLKLERLIDVWDK